MSTSCTPVVKPAERSAPRHAVAHAQKIYLYAVVSGDGKWALPESLGVDRGKLYSIEAGRLAVVASDVAAGNLRPERARVAAHHDVLKKLMAESTPLPMSFGVMADNPGAVRRMLSRSQHVLIDQLRHVAGKVEMGLRVTWDVANIFEYFVNVHEYLRGMRDQFLGSNCEATQEQKIEIGRMFDRLLNQDRDSYAELATAIFAGHHSEIKQLKCRNEREVMNLACLVRRELLPQFEADVFEVAKQFDNNFSLDYNGPWAPHNFVKVDLQL